MKTDYPSPEIYRQEARELLAEVEDILMDLEQNPADTECVHRLFRSIHTIKGSGAMYGFDAVSEFTHHVENVLEHVRMGHIPVTTRLIDLILLSKDKITALINIPDGFPGSDIKANSKLINELNKLLPGEKENTAVPDREIPMPPDAGFTYNISFKPPENIFKSGMNPLLLIEELKEFGQCSVTANIEFIPLLDEIDIENCYLAWDAVLQTPEDISVIREIFVFVEDESELSIEYDSPEITNQDDDILPVNPEPGPVTSKPRKKKNLSVKSGKKLTPEGVRIPAEKLDTLINLVGELIITQERISEVAAITDEVEKIRLIKTLSEALKMKSSDRKLALSILKDPELMNESRKEPLEILESLVSGLEAPIETLRRLTNDLRECALNMRMVSIGTVFGKFRRLVRDLSSELNRDVKLVTHGAETELDKTIIERLNDPLVHLIRNSIDHGFRPPEERIKAGKPPQGTLILKAEHSEANVIITIEDDGKGLDMEAIRSKAAENGLISEKEGLTENEVFNLIFMPGFSTSEKITEVSGRGVGMDVVKREIDKLGGIIQIESSRNRFTRFTISLPLTLAIINGLMIDVGGTYFILPLSHIVECTELKENIGGMPNRKDVLLLRGDIIPFFRLREIFEIVDEKPIKEHIIITDFEKSRIGFVADKIVGDIQTVIKPLGKNYKHHEGVSGATVLGDGTIAFILDIPGLISCTSNLY